MGKRRTWTERLQRQMEKSMEPMPGVPLVEIAGSGRVLIENHRGVICYGTEQIQVRVNYGQISVMGSGLELARMSRVRLVITGKIHSVNLLGRDQP